MTDQAKKPEVGGPGTKVTKRADVPSALAGVEGLQQFRVNLERFIPQIGAAMACDEKEAKQFVEICTTAFLTEPKLAKCTPVSLMRAVRRCAQLKLRPDGVEGAFIPRGGQAYFEPMYQGIVRTMLRTGTVLKVEARVVYSGDEFEYWYGLRPDLIHKPGPSADRGGATHAYACFQLANGLSQFEVMDRTELDHVRANTKRQNNDKEGPGWINYPGEMQRKTVTKRGSKWIEQNADLAAVIAFDNAVQEGRTYDPRDALPNIDDRTLDQRVKQHADRQTDELRDAIDTANGNGGPRTVQGTPVEEDVDEVHILDRVIGFGKKYPERTWREVLEINRGWITHWAIDGEKCKTLSLEFKAEMRAAIDELDAAQGNGGEDQGTDPASEDDADRRPPDVESAQGAPPDDGQNRTPPPPQTEWGDL